jgi:hypothetical protein
MKKITLLLTFLAAAWALNAQQTFLGTVEYDFTIEGPNVEMISFMMPEKMVLQYGKKGMKTYFEGGMMADMMGKIVVNSKDNQAFQVKDDEQTVYLMGPEDLSGAEDPTPDEVIKEMEVIKIQGYLCQKYKTIQRQEDGTESVQYIWTTEALVAPDLDTPGMQSLTGMSVGAKKGVPGFPMKVVQYEPGADLTVTLEVIKLDFTKLKHEEFEIPKGYAVAEFEMEGGE